MRKHSQRVFERHRGGKSCRGFWWVKMKERHNSLRERGIRNARSPEIKGELVSLEKVVEENLSLVLSFWILVSNSPIFFLLFYSFYLSLRTHLFPFHSICLTFSSSQSPFSCSSSSTSTSLFSYFSLALSLSYRVLYLHLPIPLVPSLTYLSWV